MHDSERKIRPALAAVVLICFFMPFLKVSCGGQQIMSVTGLDLATGKEVKTENPWEKIRAAQSGHPDDPNSPQPPDSIWGNMPQDDANPLAKMGQMNGNVSSEPSAAIGLLLAAVALVSAFAGSRKAMSVSAVTSGLCAVALLLLKSRAMGELPPEAAAVIKVEWTTAFWVALGGAAALSVYTVHLLTKIDPQYRKPRIVIQTYHEEKVAS